MGDSVTMAAFADVADAPAAAIAAETALRDAGLVAGTHDPEAVLAWRQGRVLRPGPEAGAATAYGEGLLSLLTNGVAFIGERYFHGWGIGTAEWFDCPSCAARIAWDHEAYGDQMSQIGMAAMAWAEEGDDDAQATCMLCGTGSVVTAWQISDPVFLADMAVEFWNWPHLDPQVERRTEWWHVDVVPMLEAAVGRNALLSGHKI